jgi:soluble P-type ATPase
MLEIDIPGFGLVRLEHLVSDTFGKAKEELKGVDCKIFILKGTDHDIQKGEYVKKLGAEAVVAFGNGNNDRKMLKVARIGIAVSQGKCYSMDAITAANIHVTSANASLDLLLNQRGSKQR